MGRELASLGNGIVAAGLYRVPTFQNTRARIDVVLPWQQAAKR